MISGFSMKLSLNKFLEMRFGVKKNGHHLEYLIKGQGEKVTSVKTITVSEIQEKRAEGQRGQSEASILPG